MAGEFEELWISNVRFWSSFTYSCSIWNGPVFPKPWSLKPSKDDLNYRKAGSGSLRAIEVELYKVYILLFFSSYFLPFLSHLFPTFFHFSKFSGSLGSGPPDLVPGYLPNTSSNQFPTSFGVGRFVRSGSGIGEGWGGYITPAPPPYCILTDEMRLLVELGISTDSNLLETCLAVEGARKASVVYLLIFPACLLTILLVMADEAVVKSVWLRSCYLAATLVRDSVII